MMIERALIAGLGSIGQRHFRLLRARLPDARIMVLRHSNCDEIIDGVDLCTTSIDKAVLFRPEIAIIAVPSPYHSEIAIALASVYTNLLVEKPIASNIKEAYLLAEVVNSTDIVFQVGYNLRFLKSLQTFRAEILSGRIGRVASVRAEVGQYLPEWRPGSDWRNSVSARADLGGGVLLELSHEFDYLRWIFGEVKDVRGWMGRQGGLGLDVEDTLHAVLQFTEPVPVSAEGVPPVALVTLDFIRRDTVRRCVAIGETGTLIWDGVVSKVLLSRPGDTNRVLFDKQPERDTIYANQLNAFIESVESGAPVASSASDGVAVMEIIEALRRSHDAGGAIMVPEKKNL